MGSRRLVFAWAAALAAGAVLTGCPVSPATPTSVATIVVAPTPGAVRLAAAPALVVVSDAAGNPPERNASPTLPPPTPSPTSTPSPMASPGTRPSIPVPSSTTSPMPSVGAGPTPPAPASATPMPANELRPPPLPVVSQSATARDATAATPSLATRSPVVATPTHTPTPLPSPTRPPPSATATRLASTATPTVPRPTTMPLRRMATATPALASPTAIPTDQPPLAITTQPGSVSRGKTASVAVRAMPGARCTIVVEYKSGASNAAGLAARNADAYGAVSWTWTVSRGTTPGTWPVKITCGSQSAQTTLTVLA